MLKQQTTALNTLKHEIEELAERLNEKRAQRGPAVDEHEHPAPAAAGGAGGAYASGSDVVDSEEFAILRDIKLKKRQYSDSMEVPLFFLLIFL